MFQSTEILLSPCCFFFFLSVTVRYCPLLSVTIRYSDQNTLNMPQTYPIMLQKPPMYIATSHMLHLYGPEIAQNRSKPPYSTVWPIWRILGLSGRVIWPLPGPAGAKTPSICPKHTQICSRYHLCALLPVTCVTHKASKSLKIAQNHYMALYGTIWHIFGLFGGAI
jgi:hypothetical protein